MSEFEASEGRKVVVTTKYTAIVNGMGDAFAFIADCIDKLNDDFPLIVTEPMWLYDEGNNGTRMMTVIVEGDKEETW